VAALGQAQGLPPIENHRERCCDERSKESRTESFVNGPRRDSSLRSAESHVIPAKAGIY
jgi:hypothetical protein